MIDTILFYITEYFLYTVIMISTLIGAFYFRSRCDSYEGRKYIAIAVVIIFLTMFGGLGRFIKPYFTDMSEVKLTYGESRYSAIGTGSFISPNIVLTNEHVVQGCKKLAIADKDNVYLGRLISTLARSKGDLAFIETPANRKKFAIISNEEVVKSDILIIPNYTSRAGVFDISKSLVIKEATRSDEMKNLRDSIISKTPKVRKGNSGSPVYNKKGYLVGVHHSGTLSFFKTESWDTPINVIKRFARDSDVDLYYLKNNNNDLTKEVDFKDNFAVNVLCAR